HINLLPAARGGGHGRALLSRLVTELAQQEVPGVHLEVDAANTGAVAFYRRTGFAPLAERPGSLVMARPLEDLRRPTTPRRGPSAPSRPRPSSPGRSGCSPGRSPPTSHGCPRSGSRGRSSSSTGGPAPAPPSSPSGTPTSTCRSP